MVLLQFHLFPVILLLWPVLSLLFIYNVKLVSELSASFSELVQTTQSGRNSTHRLQNVDPRVGYL